MIHEFEVPVACDRERADKVVTRFAGDLSRSRIQKLFDQGLVWREDEALSKSQKLRTGDWIQFSVPPPMPLELRPVAIPLQVLFEDEHMLAINKPVGMVVHPGAGTGEDTLVHALLHHCGDSLRGIGGVERPGIVHRLDRETSGLILAAKTEAGFQGLARAFEERSLVKRYEALVCGAPAAEHGSIDAPIGRHPTHRTRMAVRDDGRSARSDWTVLQRWGDAFALLGVRIHTGRTHQIRVHLSHIGLPLAGDSLYGYRAGRSPLAFQRVMLHARSLELKHPVSGAPLHLVAPRPADFRASILRLCEHFGGDAEAQVAE